MEEQRRTENQKRKEHVSLEDQNEKKKHLISGKGRRSEIKLKRRHQPMLILHIRFQIRSPNWKGGRRDICQGST